MRFADPRATRALPALVAALLLAPLARPAAAAEEAPTASALEVADVVLGEGCRPKLLHTDRHRFAEAQIACDGFLSYALVNEILDGAEREPREAVLEKLLADALDRARKPFLRDGTERVGGEVVPTSVLYRGYLLLMLAGQEKVGLLDDEGIALFDALAADLANDLDAKPLLPSFGHSVWPSDNALAASGLTLHGRLRGEKRSLETGDRLAAHLDELRQRKAGFPTRLDESGRVVDGTPRGTALAWTAAFLAMGDREEAKAFSSDLVTGFCAPVPFLGGAGACREWPEGIDREPDATSGPIVQGYGVGASALALAATTGTGPSSWPQRLVALAERFGLFGLRSQPKDYPLENAIFLWGEGLKRW